MGDDDLQRFITGMEPPFFQLEDGHPNNRRRRQREVWRELAAPFNSAGPAEVHQVWCSLQELEERLSDRYDELRQKSEHLENLAKVYQLFAHLLAMKAPERDGQIGESKIREAFAEDCASRDPSAAHVAGVFDAGTENTHQWLSGAFWETEEEDYPEGATFHVKPDGPKSPFTWKVETGKSPQLEVRPSKEKMEQVGIDPEAVPPLHRGRWFPGEETWNAAVKRLNQLTRPVKDQQDRLQRTAELARFRRSVLQNVLYQFEVFGQVQERLSEDEGQVDELAAKQPQPGRDSTLNDPGAYPAETLNAVLEWTGDDANRERPFRSGSHNESLCGFVSETLARGPAGWEISQDTIKARLRSLMDELNVELPHGPTNKLSYFEAREQIIEAMQERGLSVEL